MDKQSAIKNLMLFFIIPLILLLSLSFVIGAGESVLTYFYNFEDANEFNNNWTVQGNFVRATTQAYSGNSCYSPVSNTGTNNRSCISPIMDLSGYSSCNITMMLGRPAAQDTGENICIEYSTNNNAWTQSGCRVEADADQTTAWANRTSANFVPSATTRVRAKVTQSNGQTGEWFGVDDTYIFCQIANKLPNATLIMPTNNTVLTYGNPIILNVTYRDGDAQAGTVTFYNNSNNLALCTNTSVSNGVNVTCAVNLDYSQQLKWYVNTSDGTDNTKNGVWNFSIIGIPPTLSGENITAYFPFDVNASDVHNGIPSLTGGSFVLNGTFGKAGGGSAYFSFSDGFVNTTQKLLPATGNFTASCWIAPYKTAFDMTVFNQYTATGAGRFVFYGYFASTGTTRAFLNPTGQLFLGTNLTQPTNKVFTHVAITRKDDNWTYYENGSIVASVLNSDSILQDEYTFFGLSGGAAVHDYQGYIDECMFSSSAMSPADIQTVFQNPGYGLFTFPTAQTCGYSGSGNWNINCADNCDISPAYNLEGNNVNISGVGNVIFRQQPYNYNDFIITGSSSIDRCEVTFMS